MITYRKRVLFLRLLRIQLDRADLTYKQYMKRGQVFLYAKILKECNDDLRMCVLANAHLLPKDYRADAVALIHHLDVWSALWGQAFEDTKPGPTSVFRFDNHVNFPQTAVARLVSLAEEFK